MAHIPEFALVGRIPREFGRYHLYNVISVASYSEYEGKSDSVFQPFLKKKLIFFTSFIYIYRITAKLLIFLRGLLRKSGLKSNLENLFHSMQQISLVRPVARETGEPQQQLNQQYLLQTCYGKIVSNLIFNIFSLKCIIRILLVQKILRIYNYTLIYIKICAMNFFCFYTNNYPTC